jgi:ubiquinone/menaquinone biosynthesis C-methylase UbiE
MERVETSTRALAEAAALARVAEMTPPDPKRVARSLWALGDYHRFATASVWGLGPELVAACGIDAGDRVLDVAAGTGNVALRAAESGARVVASDLTPENFDAGRAEARAMGVELEWAEADAEALPFADGAFDVVTSCLGAIFAPDHRAVADEMLRVCRPGGTIGMINFTPDGGVGDFFDTIGRHAPQPPTGAQSPVEWGSEAHVRELFGDRVSSLEMTRRSYVERSPGGPEDYVGFFKATFGPLVGLYASLSEETAAALDREFLDFAERANIAPPGSPAEYEYGYLLVVARKRGA